MFFLNPEVKTPPTLLLTSSTSTLEVICHQVISTEAIALRSLDMTADDQIYFLPIRTIRKPEEETQEHSTTYH